MSIHFISGKPGGGKSLYGVRLIVEELLHGNRVVITNVPLRLPELSAYVQKEAGDRVIDVVGRVWLLNDEQTAEFWTYRPGCRVGRLKKEEWFQGKLPSYGGVKDGGVMYVVDEVHNYFGARQWAETGRDVLFYLSQHRKLGDTVVCITQAVGNVDKQFRSVTQDFTFLRNLSKERLGHFRLPSVFVRRTFASPPTDTTPAMETSTFRLDVTGLASCYDSAVGVGIHGRVADTGERHKGVSVVWGVCGLVVLICAIFFSVPSALASWFSKPLKTAVVAGSGGGLVAAPALTVVEPLKPLRAGGSRKRDLVLGVPVSTNCFVTGIVKLSALERRICLSDGRFYRFPADREVSAVGEKHVVIEGVEYRLR